MDLLKGANDETLRQFLNYQLGTFDNKNVATFVNHSINLDKTCNLVNLKGLARLEAPYNFQISIITWEKPQSFSSNANLSK